MTSKIYFSREISKDAIDKLFSRLDEGKAVSGKTVIKTHFGEKGQSRFVHPDFVREITRIVGGKTDDFFLSDTNTLYRGMRINATKHKEIAVEHGFDFAPIIIGDGEEGNEEYLVKINKKHFDKVHLGKMYEDIDSMVVVSHFKGHVLFGFGGALKNLSMGCASRAGKLAMHSKVSPHVGDGCTKCGVCVDKCPADAIDIIDEGAYIDNDGCIGCAECIAICPVGAIKVPFGGASSFEAMERGAEYAYGAVQNKSCVYFTFINNITRHCDCLSDSEIIGKDIGIIAGTDPVAMDKAAYDLLLEHHDGKDVFQDAGNPDGTRIIDYSGELGFGSKEYEIKEI